VRFEPLPIEGAWHVVAEPSTDERGAFARTWCADEFAAHGIDVRVAQTSTSWNVRRGTLRGLHLQREPHGEGKLVRCTRGRAFDVLVDLRPGPGRLRWVGIELAADERNSVWAPPGVAHGFLTLEDATELAYQMTVAYEPAAAYGVRWDDPSIGVTWPFEPVVISERDRSWPDVER